MTPRPSGAWPSPLKASTVAKQGARLGEVRLSRHRTTWVERRPSEGGRSVVVERSADGTLRDCTPRSTNCRTRVHEYGGGSYVLLGEDVVFTNFSDQSLLRAGPGGKLETLATVAGTAFADLELDEGRRRVICVAETQREGAEPEASLVAVAVDGGSPETLARHHDFFSSPRLSPDGRALAFLTWEHPSMPWDATTLWLAQIESSGALGQPRRICGGDSESVFQPTWGPDGRLFWASDRSGFWNLEMLTDSGPQPICPRAAEFGLPHWVFGMSTFAVPELDCVATTYQEQGIWHLATARDGELHEVPTGMTWLDSIQASHTRAAMVGASPTAAPHVFEVDLVSGQRRTLSAPQPIDDADSVSCGKAFSFSTSHGDRAHAFFYPPTGSSSLPAKERPVALVKSHGGPTAATHNAYDPATQFWTSRGIAVIDVNYRGSTGYGREYRDRLQGNWGIFDVDDCEAAASHLARENLVDGKRLAIRGGSAGGYTTLCALTFRDSFTAGASHYGVGDLETLARDTHKFESRYLDGLIGPYPQRQDLYVERSPIHAVDHLDCPTIFFQGTDDKIVPPNQAEAMVAALDAKGIPVAYVSFEGEGHGFRKAENIVRALEAELYFYARIFGFDPADQLQAVKIRNLGA